MGVNVHRHDCSATIVPHAITISCQILSHFFMRCRPGEKAALTPRQGCGFPIGQCCERPIFTPREMERLAQGVSY